MSEYTSPLNPGGIAENKQTSNLKESADCLVGPSGPSFIRDFPRSIMTALALGDS